LTEEIFRSGFVAIIGRPNVGKSTLLNRILGEKIVITSDKPQTTRNRIKGIHNFPGGQMIFIDTPGVHRASSPLNRYMVEQASSSIAEVDLVLYLAEAVSPDPLREEPVLELLASAGKPVVLAINKIDMVPRESLLSMIDAFSALHPFKEIVPISAADGDGVERLIGCIAGYLPEGPLYFPEDILTDLPERFVVAEIIREKVFRLTHDEIPYSTAVEIDSFRERPDGLVAISATVNVERDSQKGIVIGKRGAMLKRIGSEARRDIEALLDARVYLELFVKVRRDWSENPRMLKEMGYE
jgi:GTP-binding protein Era